MTKDEAMKLVLDALENHTAIKHPQQMHYRDTAIEALRQALEQPEQKPVAWMSDSPTKGNGKQLHWTKAEAWRWSSNITPLYTATPSKHWVSLTDEEIFDLADHYGEFKYGDAQGHKRIGFARAIEAKLKEKNS